MRSTATYGERTVATLIGLCMAGWVSAAAAQPFAMAEPADLSAMPPLDSSATEPAVNEPDAAMPPVRDDDAALPENLRRQIVAYPTREPAGTIIIDTPHAYLYYVLGGGRAMRYGIGVGRDGFRWSGTETISRMAEWPDWYPPPEMIRRQPYLPRFMAGGETNPLGARALYLGHTEYRIHGTNDPSTIGKRVSSGCIRLTNADIADLYSRVGVGTKVVVLPDLSHRVATR